MLVFLVRFLDIPFFVLLADRYPFLLRAGSGGLVWVDLGFAWDVSLLGHTYYYLCKTGKDHVSFY